MTNALMAARDALLSRHPERRVTLNGRDWGLIDTGGPGAPFLFLPGTLGRADVFFAQIAALAPHRRVLSVSYPASGGVREWAVDLAALLDGMGKVAVLGSSLGGYLAQYLAATQPGQVAHLFAGNTLHAVEGVATRLPYALDLWSAPIADLRAGFAAGMAAWAAAHPDHADMVGLLMAEANGRILEAELRARLDAIKSGPALPPHQGVPATVIESEDDPLIPPAMRAAVRARLAPALAFRFRRGGHFPYLVRAEAYTAILLSRLGIAPLAGWEAEGEGFAA